MNYLRGEVHIKLKFQKINVCVFLSCLRQVTQKYTQSFAIFANFCADTIKFGIILTHLFLFWGETRGKANIFFKHPLWLPVAPPLHSS